MRLALTEQFQADVRALDATKRAAVLNALLALPKALATPHLHAGLGLRKLHRTGIWEARVGLDLRLIFTFAEATITLVRAASHDEVRRFLRSL
jgi:mRNA-degrading endonuclease YafQ of YafQ-DinJ toxin-antitoxin module